jgi:hypothetical protein
MTVLINKLSPIEAADIANVIYGVLENQNIAKIFKPSKISNYFEFNKSSSNHFTANSGAFHFKTKTGFGVIAKG